LSYDMNPKSRCAGQPNVNVSAATNTDELFPTPGDYESLDDVINMINTLRFLCVNKWSALGDSFLACSEVGSPSQMKRSMLNTRQNIIHWNEEWID